MPIARRTCRSILRAVAPLALALMVIPAGGCRPDPAKQAANPQPIDGAAIIGSPGLSPGRFRTPRCIANDGRTLWVIDRSGRVQRLDDEGHCLQWFTMPETTLGFPTGVCVGPAPAGAAPEGTSALYVADTHYNRVLVYEMPRVPDGASGDAYSPEAVKPRLLATIGEFGHGPGQFVYPSCVAVLASADGRRAERVFVGEFGGNDRVQVFDEGLKPIASFGTLGTGDDPKQIQFNRPQGLAVDAKNRELIVADSINHRIGRFTFDGVLIAWHGRADKPGAGAGELVHPRGLELLNDGTVMVTEFGNNRVQRLDLRSGRCLGLWGRPGGKAGELAEPWALTVMHGKVFVVEGRNNRMTRFASPG